MPRSRFVKYDEDDYYDEDGELLDEKTSAYLYQRDASQVDDHQDLVETCLKYVYDQIDIQLEALYTHDELLDLACIFHYDESKLINHLIQEMERRSKNKMQAIGKASPSCIVNQDSHIQSSINHSSLAQHLDNTHMDSILDQTNAVDLSHGSNTFYPPLNGLNIWKSTFFEDIVPDDIKPFEFTEPSPDDLYIQQQKKTFVQGSNINKKKPDGSTLNFLKNNIPTSLEIPLTTAPPRSRGKLGPIIAGSAKRNQLAKLASNASHEHKNDCTLLDHSSDQSDNLSQLSSMPNITNGSKLITHPVPIQNQYDAIQLEEQLIDLKLNSTKSSGNFPSQLSARDHKSIKQMSDAKRTHTLVKIRTQDAVGKTPLNMVIIGHVDSGKSTTMGHLLHLLGNIDHKVINKFQHESKLAGKSNFHFAWVMDASNEERLHGVTINVATHHFETSKHTITILDAPGHQDFIPNLISGVSQADVAILLVNASDSEYKNILKTDQTREQLFLARSLGMTQLIVAVNKMDLVDWRQERFNQICTTLSQFLKTLSLKPAGIRFVPISGLVGENLVSISDPKLKTWYQGPTLIQAIDLFLPTKRRIDIPFRLNINDIFKDPHRQLGNVGVAGKIECGFVTVGDKVCIMPSNRLSTIKAIRKMDLELCDYATAGQNVEIGLLDVEVQDVSIGNVLCDPKSPIKTTTKIRAQIVTFELDLPILRGQNVGILAYNIDESAIVTKLINMSDAKGQVNNPKALLEHVTAMIEIKVLHPISVELFSNIKSMGRFTLRDKGKTLAAGIIVDIIE